ncbi:MAG TPA: hypothetical protein VGJ20_45180 [Xanthobacteraceae bacterium]|jgi:hypothetical protein
MMPKKEALDTREARAEYLEAARDTGDADFVAMAIADIHAALDAERARPEVTVLSAEDWEAFAREVVEASKPNGPLCKLLACKHSSKSGVI